MWNVFNSFILWFLHNFNGAIHTIAGNSSLDTVCSVGHWIARENGDEGEEGKKERMAMTEKCC